MKKHSLLKEEILPSMASNRKVQRLLNEFMDILSEYEPSEAVGATVSPVGSEKLLPPLPPPPPEEEMAAAP